jgi:hypothetical protein
MRVAPPLVLTEEQKRTLQQWARVCVWASEYSRNDFGHEARLVLQSCFASTPVRRITRVRWSSQYVSLCHTLTLEGAT